VVTLPCNRIHDTARGPAGRARSRPGRTASVPDRCAATADAANERMDTQRSTDGPSCRRGPGSPFPHMSPGSSYAAPTASRAPMASLKRWRKAPPLTPPSRRRGLPGVKERGRAGRAFKRHPQFGAPVRSCVCLRSADTSHHPAGTAVHPESSAGEGHAPVGNQFPVFDLALYPFNHLDHVSGVEEPDPVGASCGGPRRRIGCRWHPPAMCRHAVLLLSGLFRRVDNANGDE
jgi:hypothetical protein